MINHSVSNISLKELLVYSDTDFLMHSSLVKTIVLFTNLKVSFILKMLKIDFSGKLNYDEFSNLMSKIMMWQVRA